MTPPGARVEMAGCQNLQPPSAFEFSLGALSAPVTLPKTQTNSPEATTSEDSGPACTTTVGGLNHATSTSKSAKRRAAEALLERKASKQRLESMDATTAPALRSFVINACDRSCGHAHAAHNAPSWCAVEVTMPSLDWPAILKAVASNTHNVKDIPRQLPGGVAVHLVQSHAELAPALCALRASMQDGVVGIDLEWRPDYRPGSNNRIALIQLASGNTCVLIRCCCLQGNTLPAALKHLFSDPSLTFVSFSWDSCDESKMQRTYGIGRAAFARFIDLQRVAAALGYPSTLGLAALTSKVLGVTLPKSRSVSRSDWQRERLSPAQVQYAALDALVTGCVFRGLRLWHASPSPCTACKRPFGLEVPEISSTAIGLSCKDCGKNCKNLHGLLSHVKATGHESTVQMCNECGRLNQNK